MLARCAEVGLDATVSRGLGATISARRAPSARELPRISIDLHNTLPANPSGRRLSPAKVERDLEVIALLGEGGMGRVLLARQHSLDREVAIKTLRDAATDEERAALLSEGAITGHLEHPAIIPVHALGLDGAGSPVLVMKRVDGVEWSELLDDPKHAAWGDDGRDRLTAHLEIFLQVCNAVHFAHSRQIVHRDIKPQNVLIGKFGDVYLGDWGLAVRMDRPWQPQPLCGTPAYMAPEMVVGGAVDARTDVYLLGATLHHILTGQPRNQGASAREALLGAVGAAPVRYPPSVPEALGALANRATARDPVDRPSSALELKQAVADYLHHKSSIALGQSALERLAQLRALVQDGALGDEETQLAIERLSVETRFALAEALRQWSDNPAATAALRELDALLASRRARAAELERLAREHDPRVGGRPRALAFAGIALVGVGLSVFAVATAARPVTPRLLLYQSLGPLAGVLLAIALLRRQLLATAFNRRLSLAGGAVVAGIAVERTLGLVAGVSAPHMLVFDSLMSAALLAVCAALSFRWLAWLALLMASAAVVAAVLPARAMLAFSLGTGVAFVLGTLWFWRSAGDGGVEARAKS